MRLYTKANMLIEEYAFALRILVLTRYNCLFNSFATDTYFYSEYYSEYCLTCVYAAHL